MKINILTLLICFIIGSGTAIHAQKFGYLNSQKKGQQMVQDLEGKYKDLQRKEQSGEISPKALEEESKKLKDQEGELGKFEQEMQKQLQTKRQETLQPILDKVNNIIKQVATENQFTYIFDSSAGILLYAQESMDITALVKTKLGI